MSLEAVARWIPWLAPGAAILLASSAAALPCVTGRVVDENGSPVPDAFVDIEGLRLDATTGPDGRFCFGIVPYGEWELSASACGQLRSATVHVRPDGAAPCHAVEIVVPPSAAGPCVLACSTARSVVIRDATLLDLLREARDGEPPDDPAWWEALAGRILDPAVGDDAASLLGAWDIDPGRFDVVLRLALPRLRDGGPSAMRAHDAILWAVGAALPSPQRDLAPLGEVLQGDDERAKAVALQIIDELDESAMQPLLALALRDPSPWIRHVAIWALRDLPPVDIEDCTWDAVEDAASALAETVAAALAVERPACGEITLVECLDEHARRDAAGASEAIGMLCRAGCGRAETALAILLDAMELGSPRVLDDIASTLLDEVPQCALLPAARRLVDESASADRERAGRAVRRFASIARRLEADEATLQAP